MKILDANRLTDLAAALVRQGYRVIAPVREGELVRLKVWTEGQAIALEEPTVNSLKDCLLPHSEVIGRYEMNGSDFTPREVRPEARRTVVLGARPCDAASLKLLDTVFNWGYEDAWYNARRKATTVVALACTAAEESCFCTSVGHAPDGTAGADALLLRAEGGQRLIWREITEAGGALASAAGGLLREGEAAADPLAEIPRRFDARRVTEWLAGNFESALWEELTLGCLGCGACAYACSSCHCFDIQDEPGRKESVRYRCWDNCGLAIFTQHASGHNPRPDRLSRWRQRLMHKFSYIPQRFDLLGCTGCGRCVRLCPNGVSILEACERIEERCRLKL